MDKTIPKTKKDMDKTMPKKEHKDKTIPKTKTEYKGDHEIQVYYNGKIFKNKENGDWRKRHILGSFGIIIIYLNYVKSGYTKMVTMHTQGLKSFAHVLVRYFLLMNIRQLYQKKIKYLYRY